VFEISDEILVLSKECLINTKHAFFFTHCRLVFDFMYNRRLTICNCEFQVRSLESQLYPERIREITQHVQLQYHHQEVLEHSAPAMTVAATSQRCRRESQPTLPTQPATQTVGSSNSNLVSVAVLQETAAAVAQLQVCAQSWETFEVMRSKHMVHEKSW
jgi:hypothetical protein